jgi:outer membrane protein TolC
VNHFVIKSLFLLFFLFVFSFGSTLNELIEYATKHSTIIKQHQAQLNLAQLNHSQSQAQKYGELNFVGDYTHYNIERTLAPLVPSSIASGSPVTTSKDILSAGFKYTVPLFTGFAQTREVEIDNIAMQMSQVKIGLSKEQLVYNIRSLYLSVLAQKEILKAQRSFTRALKKLTKQIAYEVKVGRKAKIDLFKAQSNLQESITKEEILVSNIETAKASLSALVGKSVKKITPVDIKVKKPHYLVNRLYAKARGLAKVKVEEMAEKKADKMIEKSKASKLPQVSLAAYVGKNYGEDLATKNWDNETLWQVGVNVNYNLVDFGKRDIAIQKAKISKMQAQFQKEQTLLDLKKLLTQGIEKVKQNYATYLGNVSGLRLSKKAQKIEEVRYKNDASTLNDLLLAKSKTWLAQAKVIESKYNYQKSKYYLDYIMERGVNK